MAFVYDAVIVRPLRELYMKGPHFSSLGFWMGMEDHDICAEMTSTSSDIWRDRRDHCLSVIEKRFESVHVLLRTAILWLILYKMLQLLLKTGIRLLTPAFIDHNNRDNKTRD